MPTPTPAFEAVLKPDDLEFGESEFDVGFAVFGVALGSGGGPVVLEGSRKLLRVSSVRAIS